MIKYKLLKELPGIEVGTVFTVDDTKVRRKDGYNSTNYVNSYFGKELLNKEWFEEIKEVKSIYNLDGSDYFYGLNGLEIYKRLVANGPEEFKLLRDSGNAFLTKEEAETELKKRKAMATIKKWSHDNDGGYEWTKGVDNMIIIYDHAIDNITTAWEHDYKRASQIYYSSEEIAEQAMVELEVEYKILFNIK